MLGLEERVVIVTGAAGGIGRGIVAALAAAGARVVAADRDAQGLAALGPADRVSTVVADISDAAQVEALVEGAVSEHGALNAIVNNAGVSMPNPVADATLEEFERIVAVNVRGPFLGCKYAIPHLLAAGGGSIVNIGSINSVVAEPQLALYCMSKGAVLMLTKATALDYAARGIRCNCVCPGFVDTPINVPHFERLAQLGLDEALETFQPLGRAIAPEEIGGAVAFLVSDWSTAVTGTAVMVDGGITAKA
jgi:meso-butanediol dehydrogenase / (S,S)-butanediol dehydrogenase / diacetyl reductase